MTAALREIAARWIAEDPDPKTREQGERLLAAGDDAALKDHFGAMLEFGTAGLRGALGCGPNRMNRALVRRVTAGLARYLAEFGPDALARGVAVGFDQRHGSADFAEDTAVVLASAGVQVYLMPHKVSTPELAFSATHLGCQAAVMVTASHNPPEDNGYKVYWDNGAQIIAPHDKGIARCIATVGGLAEVAFEDRDALLAAGRIALIGPEVFAAYHAMLDGLRVYNGPTGLSIVYTAMHGVGYRPVRAALTRHGYHLVPVAEQVEPDPDFPTVRFPNPEEPGALDLALAKAREVKADLLLASDPDSDRLAVAIPDGRGDYKVLTGNQVGVLLADELLRYGAKDADRLVATTIVSTAQLARIAAAHGVGYAEVLTGCKWIGNAAFAHEQQGGRFVMGFEEALGYAFGRAVRDKDGVAAALLFADLAARCQAQGKTLLDRITELAKEHGLYASAQRSVKLPGEAGAARIAALMEQLRQAPPRELAGTEVVRLRDVRENRDRDLRTGTERPVGLPKSNVLAFDLADGGRVLARPSGTEPKIKFYFEVVSPLAEGEDLASVEPRAAAKLAALVTAFLNAVGVG